MIKHQFLLRLLKALNISLPCGKGRSTGLSSHLDMHQVRTASSKLHRNLPIALATRDKRTYLQVPSTTSKNVRTKNGLNLNLSAVAPNGYRLLAPLARAIRGHRIPKSLLAKRPAQLQQSAYRKMLKDIFRARGGQATLVHSPRNRQFKSENIDEPKTVPSHTFAGSNSHKGVRFEDKVAKRLGKSRNYIFVFPNIMSLAPEQRKNKSAEDNFSSPKKSSPIKEKIKSAIKSQGASQIEDNFQRNHSYKHVDHQQNSQMIKRGNNEDRKSTMNDTLLDTELRKPNLRHIVNGSKMLDTDIQGGKKVLSLQNSSLQEVDVVQPAPKFGFVKQTIKPIQKGPIIKLKTRKKKTIADTENQPLRQIQQIVSGGQTNESISSNLSSTTSSRHTPPSPSPTGYLHKHKHSVLQDGELHRRTLIEAQDNGLKSNDNYTVNNEEVTPQRNTSVESEGYGRKRENTSLISNSHGVNKSSTSDNHVNSSIKSFDEWKAPPFAVSFQTSLQTLVKNDISEDKNSTISESKFHHVPVNQSLLQKDLRNKESHANNSAAGALNHRALLSAPTVTGKDILRNLMESWGYGLKLTHGGIHPNYTFQRINSENSNFSKAENLPKLNSVTKDDLIRTQDIEIAATTSSPYFYEKPDENGERKVSEDFSKNSTRKGHALLLQNGTERHMNEQTAKISYGRLNASKSEQFNAGDNASNHGHIEPDSAKAFSSVNNRDSSKPTRKSSKVVAAHNSNNSISYRKDQQVTRRLSEPNITKKSIVPVTATQQPKVTEAGATPVWTPQAPWEDTAKTNLSITDMINPAWNLSSRDTSPEGEPSQQTGDVQVLLTSTTRSFNKVAPTTPSQMGVTLKPNPTTEGNTNSMDNLRRFIKFMGKIQHKEDDYDLIQRISEVHKETENDPLNLSQATGASNISKHSVSVEHLNFANTTPSWNSQPRKFVDLSLSKEIRPRTTPINNESTTFGLQVQKVSNHSAARTSLVTHPTSMTPYIFTSTFDLSSRASKRPDKTNESLSGQGREDTTTTLPISPTSKQGRTESIGQQTTLIQGMNVSLFDLNTSNGTDGQRLGLPSLNLSRSYSTRTQQPGHDIYLKLSNPNMNDSKASNISFYRKISTQRFVDDSMVKPTILFETRVSPTLTYVVTSVSSDAHEETMKLNNKTQIRSTQEPNSPPVQHLAIYMKPRTNTSSKATESSLPISAENLNSQNVSNEYQMTQNVSTNFTSKPSVEFHKNSSEDNESKILVKSEIISRTSELSALDKHMKGNNVSYKYEGTDEKQMTLQVRPDTLTDESPRSSPRTTVARRKPSTHVVLLKSSETAGTKEPASNSTSSPEEMLDHPSTKSIWSEVGERHNNSADFSLENKTMGNSSNARHSYNVHNSFNKISSDRKIGFGNHDNAAIKELERNTESSLTFSYDRFTVYTRFTESVTIADVTKSGTEVSTSEFRMNQTYYGDPRIPVTNIPTSFVDGPKLNYVNKNNATQLGLPTVAEDSSLHMLNRSSISPTSAMADPETNTTEIVGLVPRNVTTAPQSTLISHVLGEVKATGTSSSYTPVITAYSGRVMSASNYSHTVHEKHEFIEDKASKIIGQKELKSLNGENVDPLPDKSTNKAGNEKGLNTTASPIQYSKPGNLLAKNDSIKGEETPNLVHDNDQESIGYHNISESNWNAPTLKDFKDVQIQSRTSMMLPLKITTIGDGKTFMNTSTPSATEQFSGVHQMMNDMPVIVNTTEGTQRISELKSTPVEQPETKKNNNGSLLAHEGLIPTQTRIATTASSNIPFNTKPNIDTQPKGVTKSPAEGIGEGENSTAIYSLKGQSNPTNNPLMEKLSTTTAAVTSRCEDIERCGSNSSLQFNATQQSLLTSTKRPIEGTKIHVGPPKSNRNTTKNQKTIKKSANAKSMLNRAKTIAHIFHNEEGQPSKVFTKKKAININKTQSAQEIETRFDGKEKVGENQLFLGGSMHLKENSTFQNNSSDNNDTTKSLYPYQQYGDTKETAKTSHKTIDIEGYDHLNVSRSRSKNGGNANTSETHVNILHINQSSAERNIDNSHKPMSNSSLKNEIDSKSSSNYSSKLNDSRLENKITYLIQAYVHPFFPKLRPHSIQAPPAFQKPYLSSIPRRTRLNKPIEPRAKGRHLIPTLHSAWSYGTVEPTPHSQHDSISLIETLRRPRFNWFRAGMRIPGSRTDSQAADGHHWSGHLLKDIDNDNVGRTADTDDWAEVSQHDMSKFEPETGALGNQWSGNVPKDNGNTGTASSTFSFLDEYRHMVGRIPGQLWLLWRARPWPRQQPGPILTGPVTNYARQNSNSNVPSEPVARMHQPHVFMRAISPFQNKPKDIQDNILPILGYLNSPNVITRYQNKKELPNQYGSQINSVAAKMGNGDKASFSQSHHNHGLRNSGDDISEADKHVSLSEPDGDSVTHHDAFLYRSTPSGKATDPRKYELSPLSGNLRENFNSLDSMNPKVDPGTRLFYGTRTNRLSLHEELSHEDRMEDGRFSSGGSGLGPSVANLGPSLLSLGTKPQILYGSERGVVTQPSDLFYQGRIGRHSADNELGIGSARVGQGQKLLPFDLVSRRAESTSRHWYDRDYRHDAVPLRSFTESRGRGTASPNDLHIWPVTGRRAGAGVHRLEDPKPGADYLMLPSHYQRPSEAGQWWSREPAGGWDEPANLGKT